MKTTLLTLLLVMLFSTLFSGCVTKNPSIACYKGNPSCVAQQMNLKNDCPSCYAII